MSDAIANALRIAAPNDMGGISRALIDALRQKAASGDPNAQAGMAQHDAAMTNPLWGSSTYLSQQPANNLGEALQKVPPEAMFLSNFLGPAPMKAYHGARSSYGAADTYNPRKSQYKAFFAAESPELANSFARSYGEAPRVYPVEIAPTARIFDPRANPEHGAALAAAIEANPSMVSGSLMGKNTLLELARKGDGGLMEFPGVQQWLKKNKFDGWRFEDTAANPGIENRSAIGMIRPGHVRSATTGDLIYGGAGAAILPYLFGGDDQK